MSGTAKTSKVITGKMDAARIDKQFTFSDSTGDKTIVYNRRKELSAIKNQDTYLKVKLDLLEGTTRNAVEFESVFGTVKNPKDVIPVDVVTVGTDTEKYWSVVAEEDKIFELISNPSAKTTVHFNNDPYIAGLLLTIPKRERLALASAMATATNELYSMLLETLLPEPKNFENIVMGNRSAHAKMGHLNEPVKPATP